MASRIQKNLLEEALGQFATPGERDNCLRICHAALTTAMIESLSSNMPMEKKGPLGEAYASAIKQVETQIGAVTSAYAPSKKPTIFVAGRGAIPQNNH